MESMHPWVHWGSSISDMVVPNRSSEELYSHMARPHPSSAPTEPIMSTTALYSG